MCLVKKKKKITLMYYWHFQVFPLNVYFISVNISILKFSYCSFHELLIEKKKKKSFPVYL